MFWASRLSSGPSLKLEDCKVNGYSMLRLIAFDFSNPAPFCNSFSKAPSLRTLQSLFSLSIAVPISGFNHPTISLDFTSAGFHLSTHPSPFPPSVWTWTPWVQSFPMHFALPWLSVFQAMGREAKGTYWMRLMRAAQLHNIIYIICSIPWHAEYDYYFSTADL